MSYLKLGFSKRLSPAIQKVTFLDTLFGINNQEDTSFVDDLFPQIARWDYHATHINQLLTLATVEEKKASHLLR